MSGCLGSLPGGISDRVCSVPCLPSAHSCEAGPDSGLGMSGLFSDLSFLPVHSSVATLYFPSVGLKIAFSKTAIFLSCLCRLVELGLLKPCACLGYLLLVQLIISMLIEEDTSLPCRFWQV